jgi:putative peptidoglycan lipid II flippase
MNFYKNTFYLSLLILVAKLLGFARIFLIAYFIGVNITSDVYFISTSIVVVISELLGFSLYTIFVKVFSGLDSMVSSESTFRYYLKRIFVIMFFITIILWFSSRFLVSIFAPGFNSDSYILAVNSTQLATIALFFLVLNYFFTAYYNSKNSFFIPEISHLFVNIFLILYLFFSQHISVQTLILVFLFGTISQTLVLVFFIPKSLVYYNTRIKESNYKFPYSPFSILIIFSVNFFSLINGPFLQAFSSNYSLGFVSELNFAGKLNGLFSSIIITSILTVTFPIISKLHAAKEYIKFKEIFFKTIMFLFTIVMPVSIFVYYYSFEIVELLFFSENINLDSIISISTNLRFYIISLFFYGVIGLFTKFYLASNKYTNAVILYFLMFLTNMALFVIFESSLQGFSIPLSYTITGVLFTIILLLINLRKNFFLLSKYFLRFAYLFFSIVSSFIILYYLRDFFTNLPIILSFLLQFGFLSVLILSEIIIFTKISINSYSIMNFYDF